MGKHKAAVDDACPCGGGKYATCCEPYHHGATAENAEKLMRARYSAFVKGELEFVHRTWDERTRPSLAELQRDDDGKWLGLEVRCHEVQQDKATVEFIARYKVEGRAQRLHEISRFVREQGQWFYVDGSFPERK
ncbi:MAG TPA: YchJ family metal-binding protein [Burkholderiaceae bacterium]|nr:YchJ family metal-binding protein [Burkholderiaceae bacterium]